jgi:hypothetical protein
MRKYSSRRARRTSEEGSSVFAKKVYLSSVNWLQVKKPS